MDEISVGTEQTTWNLYASAVQLEVDGSSDFIVLGADRLVKIEVQLGNAAEPLHTDQSSLTVTVKQTPADTGDECVFPQKQINKAAGDLLALLSMDAFWAKSGSRIEVHAKSTNSNDILVGGKVWIYDIAPASESKQDVIISDLADLSTDVDALPDAGEGSVVVNHDSGGSDYLAYKTGGVGIDNATVRAYLTSDISSGNLGAAYIKGTTTTDVNGQWAKAMNLDPGAYTFYFFKQGYYGPDTKTYTVT